jgi:hypothetical protein
VAQLFLKKDILVQLFKNVVFLKNIGNIFSGSSSSGWVEEEEEIRFDMVLMGWKFQFLYIYPVEDS